MKVKNPQSYPMILIDHFVKNEDHDYFYSEKQVSMEEICLYNIIPLTLLVESMGQTVEYNIRNIFLKDDEKNRLLFFAGFSEIEYFRPIDQAISLTILVESIAQFSNFFISHVRIMDKNNNSHIVKGKLIHSL